MGIRDKYKISKDKYRAKIKNELKNRKQEEKGGFSFFNFDRDVTMFSPKVEGTYTLDILPYVTTRKNYIGKSEFGVGELAYGKRILVHPNVGIDNKTYICLRTINKECPICKEANKYSWTTQKEIRQKLKAKQREVFNVIDRDNEKVGVQIWNVARGNFPKMLEADLKRQMDRGREENLTFFDLTKDGKTLEVSFAEKTFGKNKYYEANHIDFCERSADIEEKYDTQIIELDECLTILPYDQLAEEFLGIDGAAEEEDEEEEEELENDDVVEEKSNSNDIPFEVDEPKPSRKKRYRSLEDAEEEDKDVGEEEEPPKTRARRERNKIPPKEDECPEDGGVFGEDNNKLDECCFCDCWDACANVCEELELKRKEQREKRMKR